MSTLDQIYIADASIIRKWLDYGHTAMTTNDLLNRLNATILIKSSGYLAVSDQPYTENPDFASLYLAPMTQLKSQLSEDTSNLDRIELIRRIIDAKRFPPQCEPLLKIHTDITGLRIFNLIVQKDTATNIFGRERDRIIFFYQTKQLTLPDQTLLLQIIDDYEQTYNVFVDRVRTERIFYEKAGSGKPPRQLDTPEDWAEAIIELQDLSLKFKQVLDDNIRLYTNPDRIRTYCEQKPSTDCDSPCSVEKSFLRGAKCVYKR